MTGFGRSQLQADGRDITVEIKSVNHRFFEFSSRVPRAYGYLEEKLKAFISEKVSRGKIDVSVIIVNSDGANAQVEISRELARSYLEAIRGMGEALGLDDNVRLTDLMRFNDIFTVHKKEEDESAIWDAVKPVAANALEKFLSMRSAEGKRLSDDVLGRLSLLEDMTNKVEELSPTVTQHYRERLFARLSDILQDKQMDEARILTEAAIFAEKTAVAEETVRLKSHIVQFRSFLSQDIPVGRKMDFLVQELNREVNTIGSKCQDLEISRIVVEMKSEIEKIREQIQNIE